MERNPTKKINKDLGLLLEGNNEVCVLHNRYDNCTYPITLTMRRSFIIPAFFLLLSCASTSTGKEVKKDTKEKMTLPVRFYARGGEGSKDYYINLRMGNFFDYHEGSALYAGTYSISGKTLNLAFNNNYYPGDLSGMATIDTTEKRLVLLGKPGAANRVMTITQPQ